MKGDAPIWVCSVSERGCAAEGLPYARVDTPRLPPEPTLRMSMTPPSPGQLAEFYAYLRHDILRVDIIYNDDFGMGYFDGLCEVDPDTGEDREIVLDDAMKSRYQAALADQWFRALTKICPRAIVRATRGNEFATTFTRESPIEASDDEIWAAIDDSNDDWATDLCAHAYEAMRGERPAPRRTARPASARRAPRRRRR